MSDPTTITPKQEKQVKAFVKDYFDKAVIKHQEREKKRAEKKAIEDTSPGVIPSVSENQLAVKEEEDSDGEEDMAMSEGDCMDEKLNEQSTTPMTPADLKSTFEILKRKRLAGDLSHDVGEDDIESPQSKRLKSETPPPPPPPPAPADGVYPSPTTLSNEMIGDEAGASMDPDDHQSNVIYDPVALAEESHMSNTAIPPPPPPISSATSGKVPTEFANSAGSALTPDSEGMTLVLGDEASDASERTLDGGNNTRPAVRA